MASHWNEFPYSILLNKAHPKFTGHSFPAVLLHVLLIQLISNILANNVSKILILIIDYTLTNSDT